MVRLSTYESCGTEWVSLPLPATVAQELERKYGSIMKLRTVVLQRLAAAMPELPWPAELGEGSQAAPPSGPAPEGGASGA